MQGREAAAGAPDQDVSFISVNFFSFKRVGFGFRNP